LEERKVKALERSCAAKEEGKKPEQQITKEGLEQIEAELRL
jgi:hypothetical protein